MKGRMSPIRHARKATGAVKDFMWLEKPDHEILAIDPRQRRNKTTGNFNTAFGGDYRIVAYRDAGVRAGRHTHLYSFYEFMAHGDKPSLKKPAAEARAGYFEGSPEFQITRIYAQESERYRSRTGNKARLKVLYRGKPLSNKQVTMTTSLGWRQDLTTNDIGEAVFTLIKEDFPDGGVDKRKSSLYVARASHIVPVAGELGGTSYEASQYVATISIRVAPSALDWESQSTAYLVTFFTVGAAGTAIAIRRRRKKTKPARSNK